MLTSALEQYREQQKIAALALSEARRRATRGTIVVATVIANYQLEAIGNTFNFGPDVLAEQDIDAPPAATASVSSLLTGGVAVDLLGAAETDAAFDRLVLSLVSDAGRTAAAVDIARRPAVTGYVRSLNPPSCSRCAVLAGRVYRYSTGFLRHPRCDCLMTPTTMAAGQSLVLDAEQAYRAGQVRGLSKGDQAAIDQGADLGRVVNARRQGAGLSIGSSVITRGDRLTPQGILRVASDRDEAISLMRNNGYLL